MYDHQINLRQEEFNMQQNDSCFPNLLESKERAQYKERQAEELKREGERDE